MTTNPETPPLLTREHRTGPVACPVCRTVSGDAVCGCCGWELNGDLVLGPPTATARQRLGERLSQARGLFDVRAAVRAARGRTEEETRRLFAMAGTTADSPEAAQARQTAGPATGDPFAAAAELNPHDVLLFAAIGPDGLEFASVRNGSAEVPGHPPLSWAGLAPALSPDPLTRRFQLAGGGAHHLPDATALDETIDAALPAPDGTATVVILNRCSGWPLPERVSRRLAARHPKAVTVATETPLSDVVHRLLGAAPTAHDYALVLARPEPETQRYVTETRTLFPAGSDPSSCGVVEVDLVMPSAESAADRVRLKIPVVALTGDRREDWTPVRVVELDVAPATPVRLTFTLAGPGQVEIASSAGTVTDSAAGWPELLRELDQARLDLPLDLVVLVELGGPCNGARLRAAIDTVERVERSRPQGRVRVAVIAYWDHDLRVRRRGAPRDRLWDMRPFQESKAALRDLHGLLEEDYSGDYAYPYAAALEDALHAVDRLGSWSHGDRALLVAATRAPHPANDYEHETAVRSCPEHLDWRTATGDPTAWIGRTVLFVEPDHEHLNIDDREAARRADDVWTEFKAADWDLISVDEDEATKIAANVLAPPAAVSRPVPFPLASDP